MPSNRCYNCAINPFFCGTHGKMFSKGGHGFCLKTEHCERTCRRKRGSQRGSGAVLMIQEHDSSGDPRDMDDRASQNESSIGWVSSGEPVVHSWDSWRDYMLMAVWHKNFTELKIAGGQLPIRLNGKTSQVWIDCGSPISVCTIGELKRTLRPSNLKLVALSTEGLWE